MTNGEKMQAVFPDIEMWGESKDSLDYSLGGMIHRVTKSWWNAEYKEPTTKNDLADERLKQNIQAYVHDFGVSEEQAEKELQVTTKNDLAVDCISRKAALDITWQDPSYSDPLNVLTEVRDKIRELPSVTPQEPRKGHWEHGRELSRIFMGNVLKGIDYEDWHCSNCHCVVEQSIKPEWNYCPNCGADMREVKE